MTVTIIVLYSRYDDSWTTRIRTPEFTPRERERLALAAWESLEGMNGWLSDPANDVEGIALARQREQEIESGKVMPLSQKEFCKRTGIKVNNVVR